MPELRAKDGTRYDVTVGDLRGDHRRFVVMRRGGGAVAEGRITRVDPRVIVDAGAFPSDELPVVLLALAKSHDRSESAKRDTVPPAEE